MSFGVVIGIVKFMLILLLALLLILLTLLVVLLISPISYKLKGSFVDEKADGTARLSFLFGVLSGEIRYHNGVAVSGAIRLFGVRLYCIEGRSRDEGDA